MYDDDWWNGGGSLMLLTHRLHHTSTSTTGTKHQAPSTKHQAQHHGHQAPAPHHKHQQTGLGIPLISPHLRFTNSLHQRVGEPDYISPHYHHRPIL